MGFMDKLKNIFFEEEEEEDVEEPISHRKEEKKRRREEKEIKEHEKEKSNDTIAKKVEVSKRETIEIDNQSYIEPKEEKVETPVHEIKPEVKKEEIKPLKRENKINTELIFDDDDFILDTKPKVKKEEKVEIPIKREEPIAYRSREKLEVKKTEVKTTSLSNNPYSKKEEVKPKSFTPSPIISPIYGILDKNYKKEEVKENKEIRISNRPSRMDLDSIRNKAFGELEYDLMDDVKDTEEKKETKKAEEKKHDKEKIYNKKDNEKPTIDKVTIGEADEYYNDLGLAYNTDYNDLSKDLSDGKVDKKENKKDKEKLEDNLFDLIESMYDREE